MQFSLSGFLKLIRYPNLIIIFVVQLLVRIFLIGPTEDWVLIIMDPFFYLTSLSVLMIAAGGYIINDYYDVKIDIINKPGRVIIGRLIKRRVAMAVHLILSIGGILLGFLVSSKLGAMTFGAAFMLWLYSNQLKRLPIVGNIVVSLLTSLSIIAISLQYKANFSLVIIFAAYAFVMSLIREVIKDMEDVRGDAKFGCKTLPILIGIRPTKVFVYTLIVVLFYIITTAFFTVLEEKSNTFRNYSILYNTIFILIPLGLLWVRLYRADTIRDYKNLSLLCKLIMITGALSMVFTCL